MLWALVKFQHPGFHRWPQAPPQRAYLANLHRHNFHVEVKVELHHTEREIEFHDLLDLCKMFFPMCIETQTSSCENIAVILGHKLRGRYPSRHIQVTVMEDGETGAIYES